jgi:type II secretory pathway pseudopilin PulG
VSASHRNSLQVSRIPSLNPEPRTLNRGYTLVEMLLTVAVLIIVLGLMVSLARYVRERSATQLTQDLLQRLDELAHTYQQANNGTLPPVPAIIAPDDLRGTEAAVRAAARINNSKFVEALYPEIVRSGLLANSRSQGGFGDLPISLYNGRLLADAWGNPIVFMPTQHPAIGMAPPIPGGNTQAFFFFSPGPDGRYLTREDNLYSYEGRR